MRSLRLCGTELHRRQLVVLRAAFRSHLKRRQAHIPIHRTRIGQSGTIPKSPLRAPSWRTPAGFMERNIAIAAGAVKCNVPADVLELVNDKAARRERKRQDSSEGAAIQAGKMLTRLRTFFGWAIAHDLATVDPTAGVRKPAKEASRDRVLTDEEIRAFWVGCDALGAPFGPL